MPLELPMKHARREVRVAESADSHLVAMESAKQHGGALRGNERDYLTPDRILYLLLLDVPQLGNAAA